jgi:hypothetical protein
VVLKRVLAEAGLVAGTEYITYGKGPLDRKLDGYNRAARFAPWLVLRDLNTDEVCAPALVARLLPSSAPRMCLHIAVRAMEAWLLADADEIRRFLAIPGGLVPRDPEHLQRPRRALVDIARRSRSRRIRQAVVPAVGTTATVGPGYSAAVAEFALRRWRPRAAAERSPSLERLLRYLDELKIQRN